MWETEHRPTWLPALLPALRPPSGVPTCRWTPVTVSVGLAVHTQGLCGGLAVGLCIQLVLGLGRGLPGEGPLATLDVLSAEDACVCTQVQLGLRTPWHLRGNPCLGGWAPVHISPPPQACGVTLSGCCMTHASSFPGNKFLLEARPLSLLSAAPRRTRSTRAREEAN